MIKYILLCAAVSCLQIQMVCSQPDWKIAGGKILTPWAEKVNSINPLPDYPRPQMVRENWKNLNGLWEYSLQPKNENNPTSFQCDEEGQNISTKKTLVTAIPYYAWANRGRGEMIIWFPENVKDIELFSGNASGINTKAK